ncbi:MAG: hypothetical protein WCG06_05670, partial [Candidatus Omnitrophota bacterium]
IIGLLIGMTFLTKAEVFFAIFTAMSSGMLLLAWTDRISVRRIFRTAALFLAGLFVPILIGVAALSCAMPVTRALAAVTLQYQAVFTPIASNVFYRTVLGIDAPAKNIAAMLSMVRWYAIVPSVLFLLCVVTNRLLRREWRMSFACAVTAVFFLAIPSFVRHLALFEIFRPLPLAMLVAAGYYFVCLRRGRTDERIVRRSLTMLVVTLFAFLLLLKMILSVRVYHYGFALALPAVLTLGMMLIYEFPLLLGKRFKEVAFVRGLSVGFCALILLMHVAASAKIYGFKNFAVGAGPDTLLTYDQRVSGAGPCLREAVGQIEKIVGKQDTLVVFPEGVMLNYLTRRRNPSPYITFVPAELTMFGEDKMAEACDKARPDCVVLVSRDMSEYGYAGFGNDYAMKLFAWLKTNYGQVAAIGDASLSGKGFGIIIAKRLVPSSGAVRTATNN